MTREEAIKILQELAGYEKTMDLIQNYSVSVQDALYMAIKALEQEPKTGHWILDETDNSITCDKCGCLIWANDISNGEAYYCPNCGAKMSERGQA